MSSVSFGSDNHSGIHPKVLDSLVKANVGHAHAYGMDDWSIAARKMFNEIFGDCDVHFVFNGTAANVLSLGSLIKSTHSVLCGDHSHLQMDECGAAEALLGCKLMMVPTTAGKVTVAELEKQMIRGGDQHYSQPKIVSITQPTEVGTVYSLAEVKQIRNFCDQHKLYLHIDGARLIQAATHLNCTLRDVVHGADVVSFGGTKNGLLGAEAVLLFNPKAREDFRYLRKQQAQLSSKMRFTAAQFMALLDGPKPVWKDLCQHTQKLAKYLEMQVRNIRGVEVEYPVQANSVFARIPKAWVKPLKDKYFFYVWDEHTFLCRWMLSFDSKPEDIDGFVAEMRKLSNDSSLS